MNSDVYRKKIKLVIFYIFSDGWEAGALHEFYKTKLKFIKDREIREKVEKVKEMALKKNVPSKQDSTEEERR